MAERFSYYGVSGNLINYLTNVLGQPTAVAAKNVNIWIGVSAIFPLLGGLIADSYLGRYKTIIVSSAVYLIVSSSVNYVNCSNLLNAHVTATGLVH